MAQFEKWKRLFSEDTYKSFREAKKEDDVPEEETPAEDKTETPPPATDEANPFDDVDAGATPVDNTTPAPEGDMSMGSPEEDAQADAEKEQEKEEDFELQGKISSILSDISDVLTLETLKYYRKVEDKALEYFKKMEIPMDEKLDLLKELPEYGAKIIANSKKNNFVDRDNIAISAVLEGAVDIASQLQEHGMSETKPSEDEDEIEDTEE